MAILKTLFLGDVVGRAGRDAVHQYLPELKAELKPDLILLNGENAAGGFGINEEIASGFYELGVDCITTGNHAFAQRNYEFYNQSKRLLRPYNYPEGTPGIGCTVLEVKHQFKVMIVNPMGRVFMEAIDDPFKAMDDLLKKYPMGGLLHAVIVDFHGEASSEKQAMGHFLDGRVSAVVGTHTHVPTGDYRILKNGTAYMTDLGMCGDYDSVIGMDKESPIRRFLTKLPTDRYKPTTGEGSVSGAYLEIDLKTGLAKSIKAIRRGKWLDQS